MTALEERVASQFLCRVAAQRMGGTHEQVAFVEGCLALHRTASLTSMMDKAKKLLGLLKKTPKLWDTIKEALGITSVADIPKALREMAQKGLAEVKKFFERAKDTFPISLYFIPKGKMPTLTDLIHRIVGSSPVIEKAFKNLKAKIEPLDQWVEKHVPNLTRPLKAAVFIWVWINVAEVSWDFPTIWDGFVGKLSFGDILGSLPETGLGALLGLLGVGYHLLPITMILRLVWLVGQKYVTWKDGTLVVNWDKISGDGSPEAIPLT